MEKQNQARVSPTNISTQDIHDALDSFRRQPKASSPDTTSKASNRDSGVSESSFVSDRLSVSCDHLLINSQNHADLMPFTSDKLQAARDPLGAQILSSSDSVLNIGLGKQHVDGTCSSTTAKESSSYQWDESQSLEREWEKIYLSSDYLQNLRTHALGGKLKYSKFRSIAWKLFLECLPESHEEWYLVTKQHREDYETFRRKCIVDPSKANDAENLMIFNPLSQEEDSPWQQYFKDNELRATITQDLDRLYPENPYFHTERVKEMMLNILFCHAKKNETLGYKQGMHELLAPLIHVLDTDSRIYRYMDHDLLSTAKCIVDPLYIEHDAFSMFSQLMDFTETWYHHHQIPADADPKQQFLGANATPFTDPAKAPPTAIVKKLNKIQDHLLRKHDPELWLHMKELDIAAPVYGLRWIRLLFSREFPFPDVLVLWDALFAEGTHLDLVDYIYIGMLQSIRNKLMAGNYNTCVIHLMKFPRVHEDVHSYVKRALALRGAKEKVKVKGCHLFIKDNYPQSKKSRPNSRPPRPPAPQLSSATGSPVPERSAITISRVSQQDGINTTQHRQGTMVVKKAANPIRKPQAAISSLTKRYTPFNEPRSIAMPYKLSHGINDKTAPSSEELVQRNPDSSRPFSSPESRPRSDSNTSTGPSPTRAMKALGSEIKTKLIRPRARSRTDLDELERDHQRLQKQVMKLNADMDSMQGMFLYCGRKMDSYIGMLQEELMKDDEADKDVIYLTLAGLKQVRDLLKGNLAFRDSTSDTDRDFIDIDNGIASRLQIPTSGAPCTMADKPMPAQANYDHFQQDAQKGNEDTISGVANSSEANIHPAKSEDKSQNINSNIEHAMQNHGKNSVQVSSTPQHLESFLESHAHQSTDSKAPGSIPVVTCAVGSSENPNELPSPEESFLASHNALSFDHFASEIPDAPGVSVTINNTQFILESHNLAGSFFSSSSGEPLDGFVFVDKDGKAQGSLTVSPTHPLEFSESDSDGDV